VLDRHSLSQILSGYCHLPPVLLNSLALEAE
jgi:hypothetical protein